MVDKTIFSDLSKVTGYMGAVLSDYTGEILVEDAGQISKGLNELSMQFNESFRDIHDVTEKANIGATRVMEVSADEATIIMACSGMHERMHLHAFVILSKGASTGLAKITLQAMIENAVKSF